MLAIIEQIIQYSSNFYQKKMSLNHSKTLEKLNTSNSIKKSQLYNRLFKHQLTRQYTYKDLNQKLKKLQLAQSQKNQNLQKKAYSPFILRNYSPQKVLYYEILKDTQKQSECYRLPLMKQTLAQLQGSYQPKNILKLSKIKYFPKNSMQKDQKDKLNKCLRITENDQNNNLNRTSCSSFLNKTGFTFGSSDKENYSILNSTRSKIMFGNGKKDKQIRISDIYPLQKLLQKNNRKSFRNKWFIEKNDIRKQ